MSIGSPWHRERAKAGQGCTETQMAWRVEERGYNQNTRCPVGIVGHLLYKQGLEDRAMAVGGMQLKGNALVDCLALQASKLRLSNPTF